uniref:Lin-28 homolog B (C. elegans) n=1 Tax=Gadus morhua TaxID=8049 RepID=A0A8C4ZM39_GADMO
RGGVSEEEIEGERDDKISKDRNVSGAGFCKWFNVRMGFGFISMTSSEGSLVEPPLDVFVHQSKLVMDGFRSLKEGEQVEFTYKKSSKGLESLRVTGPGGGPCAGSERRPKGKVLLQKRKPKGDRCYNCGGLDHHAKECGLPPQPKKCHYCQSIAHMVALCPHKAAAPAPGSQDEHASTSAPPGGCRPFETLYFSLNPSFYAEIMSGCVPKSFNNPPGSSNLALSAQWQEREKCEVFT